MAEVWETSPFSSRSSSTVMTRSAGSPVSRIISSGKQDFSFRAFRTRRSQGESFRLVFLSSGMQREAFSPMYSSRSPAEVRMEAPSRISSLQPRLRGSVMRPGTAKTALPWSRACHTVIWVPDFGPLDSTTTRISQSAAMRRLRSGKFCFRGGVSGGYSLMIPPCPFSESPRNSS